MTDAIRTRIYRRPGGRNRTGILAVLETASLANVGHPKEESIPVLVIKCLMAFYVGETRFERAASWSQTRRSAKLSYTPV